MMKKIDVLLIYEHKARELESCALIAAELQRRGYNSKVLYNYSVSKRNRIEAKVVIVPHVYDEWHLEFYTRNARQSNRCVISMQWEQVLSENSEDGIHNPTGQSMNVQHIAWGQAQVDRYLRNNINKSNIHETGCVPMDLFRPEFRDYFLTKEQLAKELEIDATKEWVLFISSFAYANRSRESIESTANKYGSSIREFAEISKMSYDEILKWLHDAAKENPDKLFIYRKHPAETLSAKLLDIEKSTSNFRCIDDYSMRQWSLVADRIYNWFSTSLADVYFAHKSCYILRPMSIPRNMDVSMMVDADFITTYKDFSYSLQSIEYHFPVDENCIKYFYSNNHTGKMAYEKVVDLCEEMIKNPQMGCDFHFPKRNRIKRFVSNIYDYTLHEYAIRFKTNEKIINRLRKIPKFRTLASKLKLFNQELYGADKLFFSYYCKFVQLLKNRNQ